MTGTPAGEDDDMAEFFDQWPEPFGEYRQSTTACCPRQTIPDSCGCLEGCECSCRDCDCGDEDDDECE